LSRKGTLSIYHASQAGLSWVDRSPAFTSCSVIGEWLHSICFLEDILDTRALRVWMYSQPASYPCAISATHYLKPKSWMKIGSSNIEYLTMIDCDRYHCPKPTPKVALKPLLSDFVVIRLWSRTSGSLLEKMPHNLRLP
jgi:hypothetical protein